MVFTVRPQFPRRSPSDRLLIRYFLSTRTGVAVQLVPLGDSIQVWTVMNDASYPPYQLPRSVTVNHPLSEIQQLQPEVGGAVEKIRAGSIFSPNAVGNLVLNKGFDTDAYPVAVSVEPPLGTFVQVASLSSLSTQKIQTRDDVSPWPIFGTIELKWERH